MLWKPRSLSAVYFGSLVFWHLVKISAQRSCLNERTAREVQSSFGHILDLFFVERAGESLLCFGLCLTNCDGFNLFLYDTDLHVDLSALDSIQ